MKKITLIIAATFVSAASFAQTQAKPLPWQKETKLKAAKAVQAPAIYKKAIKKADAMITEQPDGQLYKNMFGYAKGFISQWGMIYEDVKDGVARDFVVGSDGAYYMKSPISFQPTESWIKGEKGVGDTIVFKLPQQIYTLDDGYSNYSAPL